MWQSHDIEKNAADEDSTHKFPQFMLEWKHETTTTYTSLEGACPVLCRLVSYCSVASTRGLKRISIAIPLLSSEISRFIETATKKAFYNPGIAITAVLTYRLLLKSLTNHLDA